MILIRSLLYEVVLVGSVVAFSAILIVLGPVVSVRTRDGLARAWARLNLSALRWICRLRYRVRGLDSLPSDASIVLCKHQSAWETIALWAILPPHQSWVVKRELMRIPFFGRALRQFDSIPIDRSAGRSAIAKLIRDGLSRLDAGRWVIVFPEGTRVAPGARHAYAIGGALLAERSGRPVVPIAHNAGNFWGRRSMRKHPGTIDLVIGPAISTRGRKASDINVEAETWIERTVASLPGTAA
ncbi:MAG: 1-acyl-sn-glycerol-3-phosphate acyltransferase [Thiocapsa sp.]|jgi:1-acyl-sn-glycerol-3-phosphate acyltransferase|nr:lysophospholipid acyltransferase family protein [Thiocapsa sp.]MCG6898310.1 1-acyl-sn-glycerol-3-phosphate acyltransferase [Thiocapsa sp.]MCG6985061.1 1-acyl-sn-glycerol-3-phosphate acyltransferase [Thiocapsa sp.]